LLARSRVYETVERPAVCPVIRQQQHGREISIDSGGRRPAATAPQQREQCRVYSWRMRLTAVSSSEVCSGIFTVPCGCSQCQQPTSVCRQVSKGGGGKRRAPVDWVQIAQSLQPTVNACLQRVN